MSSRTEGAELDELGQHFRARDDHDDAPPVSSADVVQEIHRGDPPGGATAPGVDVDPRQFSKYLAEMLFGVCAMKFGDHWKLSDLEADMIAGAVTPLSSRMLAVVSGWMAELTVAAVVLWPICATRIAKDVELAKAAPAEPAPE